MRQYEGAETALETAYTKTIAQRNIILSLNALLCARVVHLHPHWRKSYLSDHVSIKYQPHQQINHEPAAAARA